MDYDIDESKFNMWRGTIAIAHADGIVTDIEKEWLAKHLAPLPLTETQKETLQEDLENGLTIDEILPLITDNKDRANLLHFANILFREDGLDKMEEKQYKILTDKIIGEIDLLSAMKEVEIENAKLDEIKKEHDSEFRGFFRYLISYFENR
jgi:uncharacterized membrane protein YebE (DUF533 family)